MHHVVVIALEKKFEILTEEIKAVLKTALSVYKMKNKALEVYIVPNRTMKKNVLAYPAPKGFPRPDISGEFLGEIYINPNYIKQKKEDFFYMLIHGFLHLLGYDHQKKDDTITMEQEERKLLKIIRKI